MKLQHGFGMEKLNELEDKLEKARQNQERLELEVEERIRRVKRTIIEEYSERQEEARERVESLLQERMGILEQIKSQIHHPRRELFEKKNDAAQVLIHYWQGKHIEQEQLLQDIACGSSKEIYGKSVFYAQTLTTPGSPEREYVEEAINYLWKSK